MINANGGKIMHKTPIAITQADVSIFTKSPLSLFFWAYAFALTLVYSLKFAVSRNWRLNLLAIPGILLGISIYPNVTRSRRQLFGANRPR